MANGRQRRLRVIVRLIHHGLGNVVLRPALLSIFLAHRVLQHQLLRPLEPQLSNLLQLLSANHRRQRPSVESAQQRRDLVQRRGLRRNRNTQSDHFQFECPARLIQFQLEVGRVEFQKRLARTDEVAHIVMDLGHTASHLRVHRHLIETGETAYGTHTPLHRSLRNAFALQRNDPLLLAGRCDCRRLGRRGFGGRRLLPGLVQLVETASRDTRHKHRDTPDEPQTRSFAFHGDLAPLAPSTRLSPTRIRPGHLPSLPGHVQGPPRRLRPRVVSAATPCKNSRINLSTH